MLPVGGIDVLLRLLVQALAKSEAHSHSDVAHGCCCPHIGTSVAPALKLAYRALQRCALRRPQQLGSRRMQQHQSHAAMVITAHTNFSKHPPYHRDT